MSRDQYSLLKEYLYKNTTSILTISISELRNYDTYKVFLNGDWIGITKKYVELESEMTKLKLSGFFDQKNVSIIIDHDESEIRVYCDSGRLYRPILRVEDNQIVLTNKQIDSISLNKSDKATKVTGWDEFTLKYSNSIEYICMELQPYILIAHKPKVIKAMKEQMENSLKTKNESENIINRYDESFYLKYTHCEIHPSLLLGEIITNISFIDCNQAPRVMFAYAQGRQAMGMFATNYRSRLDNSFILYHPQRPIVSSRTAKYTNAEILPSGENAIVAIACYSGLMISPCHTKRYGKSECDRRRY
jgi:DNA-directed RNA polymerase II subunit RPB2